MSIAALAELPPWEWPDEAHQLILAALVGDESAAEERLVAAELAGDLVVIDDELVGALLALLADDGAPEELRGQAAISLGPVLEDVDTFGFDDPDELPISEVTAQRIKRALREAFEDTSLPKQVRRRALEGSVRCPEDWHAEAIGAAYVSDDATWRLSAVFGMRWVRGFDAQILEALQDDDEAVALEAIHAAGAWEIDGAWPLVVDALDADPVADKDRLLAAIAAVVAIRPERASGLLADLLDVDDEEIVDAVDEALSMAGALSQMEEIERAWGDEE